MRLKDFNLHGSGVVLSPLKQYIYVMTSGHTIEVLELLKQTEKGIQVSLTSRPVLYRGNETFWMPKSAFKKFNHLGEHLELKQWYIKSMDKQTKINLNLVF
jgi:hypothetical protein